MKELLKTYVPQVILIVISVVLGILFSGIIEKRADRLKGEEIVTNLVKEIQLNLKELEDWHPFHVSVKDKLDSIRKEKEFLKAFDKNSFEIYKIASERRTLMNARITDVAWETAKLNPVISEIPFSSLTVISNVYAQQLSTFQPLEQVEKIMTKPYYNSIENSEENLRLVSENLWELLGREKQLIFMYREALKALN